MKKNLGKTIFLIFITVLALFLIHNFLLIAQGPPTATTLSPIKITETSAQLRGSVNPNGLATQVDFASCDPSSSPSYFPPTPLQGIGSGTSPVTVTYLLLGLKPGTTYSYTVRAVNNAGSQNGGCITFTTTTPTFLPTYGVLEVISNEGGYMLYLNESYVGTDANGDGIIILSVTPGTYKITLRKSGCDVARGSATVVAHSKTIKTINMTCQQPTPTPTQTQTPTPTPTPTPTQPPPTEAPNKPPEARAGNYQTVKVGEPVHFDASASTDSDGEIVEFEWDFGDGEKAYGEKPIHIYKNPGTYLVTLVVIDDDGAQDEDFFHIIVEEEKEVEISSGIPTYVILVTFCIALILLRKRL